MTFLRKLIAQRLDGLPAHLREEVLRAIQQDKSEREYQEAYRMTGLELNEVVKDAYATAQNKGWYDGVTKLSDVNIPEKLALIHSEVSEALEEYRLNPATISDHHYATPETPGALRKPVGFPSELADVIIRCCDLAGHLHIDLEEAVREKLEFNKTRPRRHGGKAC